jgi:hypothetical protein
MFIFPKQSIREGVIDGLEERAGLRRGCALAEDMFAVDRGDDLYCTAKPICRVSERGKKREGDVG